MSSSNKLDISTEGLNLRLEGDRNYVERAYASMRRVIAEQFYETMLEHREAGRDTVEMDMQSAQRDSGSSTPDENFINVVISEDVYNKLYLLEEDGLRDSFLGDILALEGLNRLYLDEEVEKMFRDSIDLGDTLWRELTPAGKAAIGRGE